MKRGTWMAGVVVGLIALGVPGLAGAEMKLAMLNVKGMVCTA